MIHQQLVWIIIVIVLWHSSRSDRRVGRQVNWNGMRMIECQPQMPQKNQLHWLVVVEVNGLANHYVIPQSVQSPRTANDLIRRRRIRWRRWSPSTQQHCIEIAVDSIEWNNSSNDNCPFLSLSLFLPLHCCCGEDQTKTVIIPSQAGDHPSSIFTICAKNISFSLVLGHSTSPLKSQRSPSIIRSRLLTIHFLFSLHRSTILLQHPPRIMMIVVCTAQPSSNCFLICSSGGAPVLCSWFCGSIFFYIVRSDQVEIFSQLLLQASAIKRLYHQPESGRQTDRHLEVEWQNLFNFLPPKSFSRVIREEAGESLNRFAVLFYVQLKVKFLYSFSQSET